MTGRAGAATATPADELSRHRPVGSSTLIAALVIAGVGAAAATASLDNHRGFVAGFEIVAVGLLAVGILFASSRMAAIAVPFAMAGVTIGSIGPGDIAWGWPVVLGALWYVATELALWTIGRHGGMRQTAAVEARRHWEVATVVTVAATLGLVSFALAAIAPDRDLLARSAGVALLLAGLWLLRRRLGELKPD